MKNPKFVDDYSIELLWDRIREYVRTCGGGSCDCEPLKVDLGDMASTVQNTTFADIVDALEDGKQVEAYMRSSGLTYHLPLAFAVNGSGGTISQIGFGTVDYLTHQGTITAKVNPDNSITWDVFATNQFPCPTN